MNPREIRVCQRFQAILSKTDIETESCKLNAEFEIINAKRESLGEASGDEGKGAGSGDKKGDSAGGAAANDEAQPQQPAAPAGTLEEQLQQTNLWCGLRCPRAGDAAGCVVGGRAVLRAVLVEPVSRILRGRDGLCRDVSAVRWEDGGGVDGERRRVSSGGSSSHRHRGCATGPCTGGDPAERGCVPFQLAIWLLQLPEA